MSQGASTMRTRSTLPFDWVGVIGTGQSLSVGATATYLTTTQPFHNLKLVDTGRDPKYPIYPDAGDPAWAAVPLVEPIRVAVADPDSGGYGDGQYPDNIAGETPHSGMANTLTSLWRARGGQGEYITAHTVVGWSGHCLTDIDKEGGKRAYPASLEEARVYTSLARAAGKTFGYGGIILTHGECDHTDPAYGTGLYQMWNDYNADLKAITGRTRDVVLLVFQESAVVGGPMDPPCRSGKRASPIPVKWWSPARSISTRTILACSIFRLPDTSSWGRSTPRCSTRSSTKAWPGGCRAEPPLPRRRRHHDDLRRPRSAAGLGFPHGPRASDREHAMEGR